MKILALEFSSPVRSVAVSVGVTNPPERQGYAEESGSRKTKPFHLIDAALKEAGASRDEIECIAVGLGPGSYAGIRTAIAIAQGWQLARGVKVLGISSAEVVAAHAGQFGIANPVFVGLEAQRGKLFVARYDASVFERPALVEPFRLASETEMKNLHINRMDWPADLESGTDTSFLPEADFLAILAQRRTDFVSASALEPVYLRATEFVKAPPPRLTAD